ncbi:hypothetical protein PC114_g6162 [Phytophthora cactorum]|nr:hypothetical protein PC114_g6162 [Phytophthora cactorum]
MSKRPSNLEMTYSDLVGTGEESRKRTGLCGQPLLYATKW